MIKSIYIKNILNHHRTKINFINGFNILTGPSDSGKSAVCHALNWAINNKPRGSSLLSWWGEESKVIIEFENGASITRVRNKKINRYEVIKEGSKKIIVLEAFGSSVPDTVLKISNFSDLNFQMQLDKHFLLSLTSGQTAKFLNKITNLSIIDSSSANIDKKNRDTNKEISFLTSQIAPLYKELESFDYIGEQECSLLELEKLFKKISIYSTEHDELEKIVYNSYRVIEKIKNLYGLISHKDLINRSSVIFRKILKTEDDYNKIDVRIKSYSFIINKSKILNKTIIKKKQITFLTDIINKINKKEKNLYRIKTIIKNILDFKSNRTIICTNCGYQIKIY